MNFWDTRRILTMNENLLNIYFKDGRVFSYPISDAITARAHMAKIWEGGYRSTTNDRLTWYGPHYIDKIVYTGDDATTNYPDKVRGT